MQGSHVSEYKRVDTYNVCVKPILTCNMDTWAFEQSESNKLDVFFIEDSLEK